ncbi:MAG: TonB-dependent receptor [Sphingomonadaceae bacterium]
MTKGITLRSVRSRLAVGGALIAFAGVGLAQSAWAQQVDKAGNSGHDQALDEIIVTAQRRPENLQRVPISVTAFTAQDLAQKQLNSAYDLAQYTPNVQFSGAGAASSTAGAFYIRGVGQFNMHFTADPAVGIYFDGVYMARAVGSNFDLGDIAQVEVLKGPQGTLFGRNTITGAVSITTNKPTFDFGGSIETSVGSIDQLLSRATVNIPLVDGKLAARINLMGLIRNGYGTDIGPTGKVWPLGRARELAGRLQLLWKVSDNFDLLLAGDRMRTRGTSLPGGLTHFTPTAQTDAYNLTAAVKIGPQWLTQGYTSYLYITPNDNVDTAGASLTATWTPGDLTIKSITAYRDQSANTAQDFGGVPISWIAQEMSQNQWQFSQELQATGNLAGDRLKFTTGLYYFEEHSHNDTWAGLFGSTLLIPNTNTVKSISAYGQMTYALTDKLKITGGLRWTEERKSIEVETTLNGAIILPLSSNRVTFHATTPMGSLQYQWSDGVMSYASIARGFRSGGFNAQPFSPTDLIPTFPEESTTYEAGVKFISPDRRVRINLAAFYNDYTNIQLGATTQVGGVFVYRNANAAKAKIYGGEAEINAVLADGLEAYFNASYLHSKLSAVPGFSFGVSQLPMAPKIMIQSGIKYGFDLGSTGRMTLDMDTNYRTGAYPQFNPSPESRQAPYALVNARVMFEPAGSPWTFTFWSKNITNKKYEVFGQTSGSGDVTVGWFGRPREFGATAAVKF